jgi:hypothetical protein
MKRRDFLKGCLAMAVVPFVKERAPLPSEIHEGLVFPFVFTKKQNDPTATRIFNFRAMFLPFLRK